MPTAHRLIAAVAVCALHLALLVPTIGQQGGSTETDFAPEALAIEAGARPYADEELEYPPFAIPVIAGPTLVGDGIGSYVKAFQAEMLLFDLAIVLLLALALPGSTRHVLGALAAYTVGLVAMSGIVLGESDIDGAPLALNRFDLAPAMLVLAAVLARERALSATWSALLAAGVALKAFPVVLFPALFRGERRVGRAALAALFTLMLAVAIVLAFDDDFGGVVGYHTGRALQIESVGASVLELGVIDDTAAASEFSSGSWNYVAAGAEAARAISIGLMVSAYALVLWAGWRARTPHLELSAALLAVLVVLSPVLSPQFLLWLLPVSAAAYGLRVQNLVLIAATVLTQLMLQFYGRIVVDFDAEFVWRLVGRNAVLVAYLLLVCVPIVRAALRPGPDPAPSSSAAAGAT